MTFSPDVKTLATDTESKAQLWNVTTQQESGWPLGAVAAANDMFSRAFKDSGR